MTQDSNDPIPTSGALERLGAALGSAARAKKPPPVERWNPPYCGEIDMRIAADGTWFYNGTPIGRPALVKLFASVLRKDPDRFVLVTPVERVGIVVEDAPFQAVEMAVEGRGRRPAASPSAPTWTTSCSVGRGPSPALRARSGRRREALCPRARGLVGPRDARARLDLVDLGEERDVDGQAVFGLSRRGLLLPDRAGLRDSGPHESGGDRRPDVS